MEIVRTTKVKMSKEEKEAFDVVMDSLNIFCTMMRPLNKNEEEEYLFICALTALDYLEDFKRAI